MSKNCLERFWEKVNVQGDDDCWEWTAASMPRGYGVFMAGHKRRAYAHRFSWEIANTAEVPEGKSVLHSCDNPPCVNPRHLRVGTNADNVADAVERHRHVAGIDHHAARLTPRKVKQIVSLYREGLRPADIARRVGVDDSAVHAVLDGSTWKDVTGGKIRREGHFGSQLTENEKHKIVELRAAGATHAEIAEATGRSLYALRQVLYSRGMGEPRRGRPRLSL